ncbi:hypothetical protein HS088_TW08G00638 [Tripterygium wilfordii]|uniref:RNase H type-1 domain-containing protein n=1 Tax=Tripterygium wilfordii TaxID=458696 RepID=A0A7J7DD97_TRIWF|nr:hypothetical protein HS088_TW08G00638 [Tripterygium wilfordii]
MVAPSDPFFAECLAAKEALKFAISIQCRSIVLEGDSSLVISALRSDEHALSEGGLCVSSAKELFSHFNVIRCSHVIRTANSAADVLAKKAISCSDSRSWSGECPEFLRIVLDSDCNPSLVQ